MAAFAYHALDSQGRPRTGTIEARDQLEAIARLQADGLLPIRAEPLQPSRHAAVWRWLGRRRGDAHGAALLPSELLACISEIAALLEGGLPLERCLALTAATPARPAAAEILRQLREGVAGGATLSATMARHPRSFGPLVQGIVRVGETGGALAAALRQLAAHLESAATLKSALITALLYPTLVTAIAIISVAVLLRVVVPQFAPLFDGAEATLPWATRAIFSLSDLLRRFGWLVILITTGGVLWLRARWSDPAWVRRTHARLLRIPVLRETWLHLDIARWSRTLALLLGQGVALPNALATAAPIVTNAELRFRCTQLAASLREGRTLSQLLRGVQLLPESALALLHAGESSGRLAATLAQLAERHTAAFDTRVKRALTLFEPLMILGLGAVIGIIIISILGGILSVNALVL